jgi:hypothetical protein
VKRWQRNLLLLAGLLALLGLRWLAIQRAPFNWDEWALYDSVARSLRDGVLRSGGRPGLTQLLVTPLVDGCRDEVFVARAARLLWLPITLAYLAGLFALLFEWLRERPHRVHDACLGVALLGALPVFLEWSLQVRTDQLALVGAVWGGVALLRSQRRPGLALLAGLAFGLGWISSQKLAYAAALAGVLALGRLHLTRDFAPSREAWRAALTLAGFGTVLLCFRSLLMVWFTLPETHAARQVLGSAQLASAQQSVFPFYRHTIGYSQYVPILPTLAPHAVLLGGLLAASLSARRRGTPDGRGVVVLGVLALGVAVALFHAAAFSYFWMTLGLFPAVAGAIAAGVARDRWLAGHPRRLRVAAVVLWTAIALPALLASADLLRDRQAVQRHSIAFVHRNFSDRQPGFQPEGALFCVAPQGLGIWFSQRIYKTFESDAAEAHEREVERYFRNTPVHYMVGSFRLNQFPLPLRRFFAEHYQPYRDSVFVAGQRLEGEESRDFELLVEGPYRWLPFDGASGAEIDGRRLAPGGIAVLAAGAHAGRALGDGAGMLVLSLSEPPGPAPLAFYEPF